MTKERADGRSLQLSDYLPDHEDRLVDIERQLSGAPEISADTKIVVCVPVHYRERWLKVLLEQLGKQTALNDTEVQLLFYGPRADMDEIDSNLAPGQIGPVDPTRGIAYRQYLTFKQQNPTFPSVTFTHQTDEPIDKKRMEEIMTFITARRALESAHTDPENLIMHQLDAETAKLSPTHLEKIRDKFAKLPSVCQLISSEDYPYYEFHNNHLHFAIKRFIDLVVLQLRTSKKTQIRNITTPHSGIARRLSEQIRPESSRSTTSFGRLDKIIKSGRRQLNALCHGIPVIDAESSPLSLETSDSPVWMNSSIQKTNKVTGDFQEKLEREFQAVYMHFTAKIKDAGLGEDYAFSKMQKVVGRSASLMGVKISWDQNEQHAHPTLKIKDVEKLRNCILKQYDHS